MNGDITVANDLNKNGNYGPMFGLSFQILTRKWPSQVWKQGTLVCQYSAVSNVVVDGNEN